MRRPTMHFVYVSVDFNNGSITRRILPHISGLDTFDLFASGMNAIIKQYTECTAAPYITSAAGGMLREPHRTNMPIAIQKIFITTAND